MEERRAPQPIPPPAASRFDVAVAVNLVVSGGIVIEFKSTPDAAALASEVARLADVATRLKTSSGALKAAENVTSDPKP